MPTISELTPRGAALVDYSCTIPATVRSQPLLYFIHDDTDALRMEMSGSFTGAEAQQVYLAWRTARMMANQKRLVVDISHLTEADDQGHALLRAWQREGARIVASSATSRIIADDVRNAAVPNRLPRRTIFDRFASTFLAPCRHHRKIEPPEDGVRLNSRPIRVAA